MNDAARIICKLKSQGDTQAEIESAIQKKCPWEGRDIQAEATAVNAAMQGMIGNLDADNAAWEEVRQWLKLINAALVGLAVILTGLGIVLVLAPPARLAVVAASRGVRALTSRVEGFQGTVIRRKAANDDQILFLERMIKEGYNFRKAA